MYVIQDMVSSTCYTCFGDPRVADNIDALNYAVVQCTHEFPGDHVVKVLNRTSSGDVELLYGYVKKCTSTTKGQYEIEVSEMAYELVKLKVGTGPTYTINTTGTVDDVIDDILTGSGWTRQSTASDVIPNNQLRNIDMFSAVKKVLTELSPTRYYFWFDSTNKYVYFGEYRNDQSATNFDATRDKITKNIYRDTNKVNYTAVKVLASDSTIYAISPTSYTGQDAIVLQMLSATTQAMCQNIADRLVADKYGDEYKRITVAGAPTLMVVGGNTIYEGDKVQVDTIMYIVTDVITKPGKITWGLNRAERSMWDLVGSDILEVSGLITSETMVTAPSQQADCSPAAPAEFYIDIPDKTKISKYKIGTKFENYQKSFTPGTFAPVIGETAKDPGTTPNVVTPWATTDYDTCDVAPYTFLSSSLGSTVTLPVTATDLQLNALTGGHDFVLFYAVISGYLFVERPDQTYGQYIQLNAQYNLGGTGWLTCNGGTMTYSLKKADLSGAGANNIYGRTLSGTYHGTIGQLYITGDSGSGYDVTEVNKNDVIWFNGYPYVVDGRAGTTIDLKSAVLASGTTQTVWDMYGTPFNLAIIGLIPGTTSSVNVQARISVSFGTLGLCVISRMSGSLNRMPRHTHSMTTTTHEHDVADTGSTGTDTNTPTVIATLPTNVVGTLTKPGGSSVSLGAFSDGTELDITSQLTENGRYKVSFSSSTAGIIHLTSVYGQY